MAVKPPAAPKPPTFAPKGSKAQKTYIWSIDSKGNLVKVEASVAKKSFATLNEKAQTALSQFLIQTNVTPTTNSMKTLWDKLVDGAASEFVNGRQNTPWDVLNTITKNTPINTGVTAIQIKDYSPVTANALVNSVAQSIGFDVTQLTDADRADFAAKLKEAAGESGKITTKTTTAEGTVTTVTPDLFDPKTFTENWLWSKVNFGDTSKLPTKAITNLTAINKLAKGYGIDYLSETELARMAVDFTSGKTNTNTIAKDFAAKAAKNYPLLAQRLIDNPGTTVMDLASPAISAIAKWLEIDPNSIDLSNPYLDKYLRPDGLAGKVEMPSMADFITTLKNSPDAEKTTWANEAARGAATSLARAMGFGI